MMDENRGWVGLAATLLWILGVLFNLALVGAVIYVAYHFITKYW